MFRNTLLESYHFKITDSEIVTMAESLKSDGISSLVQGAGAVGNGPYQSRLSRKESVNLGNLSVFIKDFSGNKSANMAAKTGLIMEHLTKETAGF
ncbi:Hypothetical predicted protein [Octopus vulgaris]|uniref:Uncharacterized protein n=1 Tax=Octopus vulgaris TaxID=6645 RepID=A0AA36AJX4_OCTVU|nr:Hypothetical predicted protein [Octopus vulgaris]